MISSEIDDNATSRALELPHNDPEPCWTVAQRKRTYSTRRKQSRGRMANWAGFNPAPTSNSSRMRAYQRNKIRETKKQFNTQTKLETISEVSFPTFINSAAFTPSSKGLTSEEQQRHNGIVSEIGEGRERLLSTSRFKMSRWESSSLSSLSRDATTSSCKRRHGSSPILPERQGSAESLEELQKLANNTK